MRQRRSAPFIAWIASFAILMSALAPAISQALQGGTNSSFWAEVCTTLGTRLVNVGAGVVNVNANDTSRGEDGPIAPAAHLLEHCPYCSVHATALGLPPDPLPSLALRPLVFSVPELFLQAPRTLYAWAAAQPRGPPLST